ncbi:MAG: hypothetical protein NVSMB57_05520 [Actinomycetota bacterium]
MRRSILALSCAIAAIFVATLLPARASLPANLLFGPSVRPPCEETVPGACGRNSEPALAVDPDGNLYLSSILGVPGGVNLWKRPAGDSHLHYLGLPDADELVTPATNFAPGGGDIDLAVANKRNSHGTFNVYAASLSAASVTFLRSEDGGATFKRNLISTAPLFVVDRQWVIADGSSNVFLVYRDSVPQWYVRASTDGGDTFAPPVPLIAPELMATAANPAGLASRAGNLAFNHSTGELYMAFANVATPDESVRAGQDQSGKDPTGTVPKQGIARHVVYLARWKQGQAVATDSVVYNGPVSQRVDAIFPTVAVDKGGVPYVGWSTTAGVFMASSKDGGAHFDAPVKASSGTVASTIQPWAVAGDAGRVAVAFLGTSATTLLDPNASWYAYTSVSTDGGKSFTQAVASDHVMHHGTVCLRGLQCDIDTLLPGPVSKPATLTDRTLAEVTALAIDADGLLVTSWPDNGSGSTTYPYLAKQIGGPAMIGHPTSSLPIEPTPGPGTFTASGATTLFFQGAGSSAVSTPDGFAIDAPFINGVLATGAPSNPHVGVVGYATTETPGVSKPAIFESAPLTAPLGIGGSPTVTVYLQGEAGAAFAGVMEYRLVEFRADHSTHALGNRSISGAADDACCRFQPGATGVKQITIKFPTITPALLAKGSRLRLELRFTALVESATRFFYGSPATPASLQLVTGTFA